MKIILLSVGCALLEADRFPFCKDAASDYLQVCIFYGCSKQLVTEAMKGQELFINRKANVYLSALLFSPLFYPLSKNKAHCSQGVEFEVAAVCLADSFPKSRA